MSLSFNGSSESIQTDTQGYAFDLANAWSVMVTAKPTSVAGTRVYFHISDVVGDTADTDNMIEIKAVGSTVRLTAVDHSGWGTPAKVYDFTNAVVTGTWYQFVATWNGSALVLYKNGAALSPTTMLVNEAISHTGSSDKGLMLGDSFVTQSDEFQGLIHSAATWSGTLTASGVSQIWNGGNVDAFNLTTNSGAYTNAADCRHWYRLGENPGNLGQDYGVSPQLIDLTVTNMTAANIDPEVP